MAAQGWQKLLAGYPWFEGEGNYPITAYSEFMPPPRLGRKPYGSIDHGLCREDDPCGWHVTEYEEALELQPGLAMIAKELLHVAHHLGCRDRAHGIARKKLDGNPYWPDDLETCGAPPQERYVLLLPLALSRTQDDKGRVRWSLFGGSEQGPAKPFWKSFYTAPRREVPAEWSEGFIRRLLAAAYDEQPEALANLRKAGFRVYTNPAAAILPSWKEEPLPKWTEPYRWEKGSLRGVRYLLTFCPWKFLPAAVRRAYLGGELNLLPFPGSLVFFGAPPYLELQSDLPLAGQIPLLQTLFRHEAAGSIRIPQSGWLHEARPGNGHEPHVYGPVRDTFRRSHRWQRIHRNEDPLAVAGTEDKLTHVLLSTAPNDISLYNKPMARNAQIWSHDYELLLDGPRATPADLQRVADRLAAGGLFGYRMIYPAMRVGEHEVYWHRPLVAYRSAASGEAALLPDAPRGYLAAYRCDKPRLDRAVELWPRMLDRPLHRAAVGLFSHIHENHLRQTLFNIRKLLDTRDLLGRPLDPSLARQLLTLPKHETLEDWLQSLPGHASNAAEAVALVEQLRECIGSVGRVMRDPPELPVSDIGGSRVTRPTLPTTPSPSLTYDRTAKRSYEKAYWQTIAKLSTGRFKNKDNADCVIDPETRKRLKHHHRDLEALGDYLLAHYAKVAADHAYMVPAGMTGQVLVGELPFRWQTDFQFSWSGGWNLNQDGETYERDLVFVIPGKNRRRAVIMADHYDTAYMEDVYGYFDKGGGPRIAAAGADDNHSATAAMMLAAPIFLDLARQGKLETDIWLVHLTGEEFPSDCMGARALCQRVVEGSLKIRLADGRWKSLAKTRVEGVYVMDMIAHNNDREQDVFQIAPGVNRESMLLAEEAHAATEIWNASTPAWNRRAERRGASRGKRSADGLTIPDVALHLPLSGEVRPPYYRRSALYNTDGQIFSDAGVPVVLFMENYDINRQGYHDTHDTLENIDLDYGAALSAIAIESVARAAGRR